MGTGLGAFTLFHVALSLVGIFTGLVLLVIGAVVALYLNVFVLIAQLFMKIPALNVLAPTPSVPPFLGTQVVGMLVFIVLGTLAAKRSTVEAAQAA
jgi:hypothetical protein